MLLSSQKPAPEGEPVGRPRSGQMPIRYLRVPDADWDDLRSVAGRRAHAVIRDFIRWYLRRPGAKMPERPSREEIDAKLSGEECTQ